MNLIDPGKLLSLAERTFNTEVDEVLAEDILQLVNKVIEPVQLWALHSEDGTIQMDGDTHSLMVFDNEQRAKEAELKFNVKCSPWKLVRVKL